MQFNFRVSYLDQKEYDVWGDPNVKSVEEYSAPQHTIDYFRTIYNHREPGDFERDIIARQGGVRCNYCSSRWTPEFYEAYCQWKRDTHEETKRAFAARKAKYGADWIYEVEPLVIPRPIYWSQETHQWETEPWYVSGAAAAEAPALAA